MSEEARGSLADAVADWTPPWQRKQAAAAGEGGAEPARERDDEGEAAGNGGRAGADAAGDGERAGSRTSPPAYRTGPTDSDSDTDAGDRASAPSEALTGADAAPPEVADPRVEGDASVAADDPVRSAGSLAAGSTDDVAMRTPIGESAGAPATQPSEGEHASASALAVEPSGGEPAGTFAPATEPATTEHTSAPAAGAQASGGDPTAAPAPEAAVPAPRAESASGDTAATPRPPGASAPAAVPTATPAESLPRVDDLPATLEAILMIVDEPVGEIMLGQILDRSAEEISSALEALSAEYTEQGRGFDLRRQAGGWRFYTRDEYAAYVERFVLDGQQARLTKAALETLAVVAYKQPVTRARISGIRGVNCDGVIRTLLSRGLVEECGAEPDTGAHLYRTTVLFLEKLGINSIDELPPLAPFLPDDLDDLTDGGVDD